MSREFTALSTADSRKRRERRVPPPLDKVALEQLALAYVARYATSAAKLASYLARKLKERGWAGEGRREDAADRFVEQAIALGYVDDAAWARGKARSLAARGYGARRLGSALYAAGIAEDDGREAREAMAEGAWDAAIRLARRRRLGPFGPPPADRPAREKQIAAMLRAGHDMTVTRAILSARDEAALADVLDAAGQDTDILRPI